MHHELKIQLNVGVPVAKLMATTFRLYGSLVVSILLYICKTNGTLLADIRKEDSGVRENYSSSDTWSIRPTDTICGTRSTV